MTANQGDAPTTGGLPHEGAQRFVDQAFELWINPEFERREKADSNFDRSKIIAAQVIWAPDATPIVRLNEEVRGSASVKAAKDLEKGQLVFLSDFDDFDGFELIEEEIDCQHVTLIRSRQGVFAAFNFLSRRGQAAVLVEKARQFLMASQAAMAAHHDVVVMDTLFSACELAAKADLMTRHFVNPGKSSHKAIGSALNRQRQMGNVDGAFTDLFNQLANLRSLYRYASSVADTCPVSADDIELVGAVIDAVAAKIAPRVAPNEN